MSQKFQNETGPSPKGKPRVVPIRQRTQFSCVAASAAMCLGAFGYQLTEEQTDRFFIQAEPFVGASWDDLMGCMQYFGLRTTLVVPSTVRQLKEWIEAGSPVLISWNPEGKRWSHSSLVFDVVDRDGVLYVYVADPNISNPSQTVRVMSEDDFYKAWYSFGRKGVTIRRPAMRVEREVDLRGKQTMSGLGFIGR